MKPSAFSKRRGSRVRAPHDWKCWLTDGHSPSRERTKASSVSGLCQHRPIGGQRPLRADMMWPDAVPDSDYVRQWLRVRVVDRFRAAVVD